MVTGGDWVLDWLADGFAIYDTVTAEFDGLIGHVSGPAGSTATAPTFSGTATLLGTIRIFSPNQLDIPLDSADPTATATVTLVDVGCDDAVGTLLPSMNQQAEGIVVFDGIVTWTGVRTGS